jgi:integrase
VYQYRLGGREAKTRRYTIGAHGSPWTPATARKEAERLAQLVGQGIDPAAADRERRRVAVDLALRPYGVRFLESCTGGGWRAMVERTLRLHVVPAWGEKPLPTITRADVSALLDRIPQENVALRRNVFAVVRRLFRWAVSRGDLERSPCEGVETPPAVIARDRVLSDDELLSVWRAAPGSGKLFNPIVRMLILTGQRREEVAGLDWQELDRKSATWVLPRGERRTGRQTWCL